MEDNTPEEFMPLAVPEPSPPDPITAWTDDERERLEALRDEASQLLREHFDDGRADHLKAITTGLRNLLA